jgi:hypothetical protein
VQACGQVQAALEVMREMPERDGHIKDAAKVFNECWRVRFGRARMELRRGGSGQNRTEGNEAAHGDNLARTATEEPTARQGRGECRSGNTRKKSNHAG